MNLRFQQQLFTGIIGLLILAGCTKEYDSIEQQDDKNIQAYIKTTGLTFQQYGTTGIFSQVIKQGNGSLLDLTKKGPVIMTIKAINGSFAAVDTFASFNRFGSYLGYLSVSGTKATETIPQLVTALQMKTGGSIRLLIPSKFLFGRNPSPKVPGYNVEIPGNTSLDVTMSFVNGAKQAEYDDLSIRKYIQSHNLTGFTKNAQGTYYKINAAGSTNAIAGTSVLLAEYSGKLFNGAEFDTTSGTTGASFTLNTLIPGWQQTLPLIQEGGSIDLIVPSTQGYGISDNLDASGNVKIPAFSCLYFTIKITTVTN